MARPCWVSLSGFVWTNLGHKAPILCSSLEILLQCSRHDAVRQQRLWEHGVWRRGAIRCFLDFKHMIHVHSSYVCECAIVPRWCKMIGEGGQMMSCCENSDIANPPQPCFQAKKNTKVDPTELQESPKSNSALHVSA